MVQLLMGPSRAEITSNRTKALGGLNYSKLILVPDAVRFDVLGMGLSFLPRD